MSIQPRRTLNADRIVTRTHDSIDTIIDKYETKANEAASCAYDETYWADLQRELTQYVQKIRVMLSHGGYTEQATELRELAVLGIRTAVENARASVQDNPYDIQNDETWTALRRDIHTYEIPSSV